MAHLSDFRKGQIVGARMAGASVTKTAEIFGVATSTISKAMTAFEKEEKPYHWSKTLEEIKSCLIGNIRLLRGLLGRITRTELRKFLQSLMNISRTQFPQKLFEGSCTKSDFTRGLQTENHIRINLFEISRCFYYSIVLSIYKYI